MYHIGHLAIGEGQHNFWGSINSSKLVETEIIFTKTQG